MGDDSFDHFYDSDYFIENLVEVKDEATDYFSVDRNIGVDFSENDENNENKNPYLTDNDNARSQQNIQSPSEPIVNIRTYRESNIQNESRAAKPRRSRKFVVPADISLYDTPTYQNEVKEETFDDEEEEEPNYPSSSAQHYYAEPGQYNQQINQNGKRLMANGNSPTQPKAKKPVGNSRFENSLLQTTKKFIELKNYAGDKILNLNDAAEFLKVPKRRLYDITNVLEGIDIVEKIGKNSIKWKCPLSSGSYAESLQGQIDVLGEQEANIDKMIADVSSLLSLVSENPIDAPYAYIKRSDFSILDPDNELTSIALRASHSLSNKIEVHMTERNEKGFSQLIAMNRDKEPMEAVVVMDEDKKSLVTFEKAEGESSSQLGPSSSPPQPSKPVEYQNVNFDENCDEIVSEEDRQLQFEDPVFKPDFEDFVIPETSNILRKEEGSSTLETPGRGVLYMSPLRAMGDSTHNPMGSSGLIQTNFDDNIEAMTTSPSRIWNIADQMPNAAEMLDELKEWFI